MVLFSKIVRFFSTTPKISTLVPVYNQKFTPESMFSLKLWGPALIILGYNIYNNQWGQRNIGFLILLSAMAAFGSLGAKLRNNSTITSISLDKLSGKLHVNIANPRPEVKHISQMYIDSHFDEPTQTLVIPKSRLYLSDHQYNKSRFSGIKQQQFVFAIPLLKNTKQGFKLPLKYYLNIDLSKNTVNDEQDVLSFIMQNKLKRNQFQKDEDDQKGDKE